MTETIEVRIPRFPECWETCGNCASGQVVVLEVFVRPGDTVRADDPVISLETGKVALDIPAPRAGRVEAVHVAEGDPLVEDSLVLTLRVEPQ